MRLGILLRRVLLILLILAAGAQYWLWTQAQDHADRVVARLIPHGELRYGRIWPFLWGGGRVWDLRFQPEGLLRVSLHSEPGAALHVEQLQIHELRFDRGGLLSAVTGRARGVRLPVSAIHGIVAAGPEHLPIPSPSELGYRDLRFDLQFRVEYAAPSQLALVHLVAEGVELGHLQIDTQLEGSPRLFARTPEQMLIRKFRLDWRDGGVLERFKDVAAARARMSRAAWEQAVIARLDERAAAEHWKWAPETVAALRRVVAPTPFLHLRLDPPGDVVLNNIRLYRMGDWPALLGFQLGTDAQQDSG